jgi:hypothetical protein
VGTAAEKRSLAAAGADAVDMESAAFAAWCDARAIGWCCLRSVSDGVDDALPTDVFDLVGARGVSLGRLTRGIIRRPRMVGDLWTLARSTRRAARPLAAAIRDWLRRPAPTSI